MLCAQCTGEIPDATFCPHCGESPLLEGSYALEEVVGHGAAGTTYRATRESDGDVVAIKELLVRKVESLKALDLFQREVRVLRELSNPGIPHFIEELHDDGGRSVSLYLVQEFIDGQTLDEEFGERRGTEREVFELAAQILDTLVYLHTLRPAVIHRDIKPANIMRRKSNGELVLIDFGSVRDAVDTAEGGSTVAGTFGYMAPEQFAGRALPATDIYGVGATIVALLSRKDPQQLVGDDRTIDWRGKLGLSPPFAAILTSMLTANVDERASDAAQLAKQIRGALQGELAVATPSPFVDVPPAPRELPTGFKKQWASQAGFKIMFGSIFTFSGAIAAAIPLGVAVTTGEWAALGMALLFGTIIGGLGLGFLFSGLKRMKAIKAAYQLGEPAEALITGIGQSSYSVNGRRATVYTYEFIAGAEVHGGEFHSWDALDLNAGSTTTVLYTPADPSLSVVFAPEQHSTTRLLQPVVEAQRQRLREQAAGSVVLDFDAEAPAEKEVEQTTEVW